MGDEWHVAMVMALDLDPRNAGTDFPGGGERWERAMDAVLSLCEAEADFAEARAHSQAALSSTRWAALVGDWRDFARLHAIPDDITERRYHRGCRTGVYSTDAWRRVEALRALIPTGGRRPWGPSKLTERQVRARAGARMARKWMAR